MIYGKISKGIPPLSISKLSKKSQYKEDEIKKLYEANKWWNYWKFQLHWNMIELVNKISKIKRKNPIQFINIFYLNKNYRTSHWVGHSALK